MLSLWAALWNHYVCFRGRNAERCSERMQGDTVNDNCYVAVSTTFYPRQVQSLRTVQPPTGHISYGLPRRFPTRWWRQMMPAPVASLNGIELKRSWDKQWEPVLHSVVRLALVGCASTCNSPAPPLRVHEVTATPVATQALLPNNYHVAEIPDWVLVY